MKKIMATILGLTMTAGLLASCGDGGGKSSLPEGAVTDSQSLEYAFRELYPNGEVADPAHGFNNVGDVKAARFFVNGNYVDTFSHVGSRQDVTLELFGENASRIVQVSTGTAFTLPAKDFTADYSIGAYRSQFTFDDSVLTYSAEHSNPYAGADGWYIYLNEWLIRHLVNPAYYTNQNLRLLNELDFEVTPVDSEGTSDGTRAYPTVQHGNLERREGYDIYRFDIVIEDSENIERPYYNIGIVREADDIRNFGLFVMKSKANQAEIMDTLVMSWSRFSSKGMQRNYFDAADPLENPNWNDETRAYFRQLMTEDRKNWGVFSYSMPGDEKSLVPGGGDYDAFLSKSKAMQTYIENEIWGRKYDIYMTYTHLGWGAADDPDHISHYFPTSMAKELAGGNGDGTRQTLEFTFQYTTNNNGVNEEISPMFDIMRGKYDEYFRRLALDIKEYGAPLMFRLNNEMNTDWTSYSGIMNLLDPDIFIMTWRRLYDIFEANGVDNVIWIWNPIATSCPYSGWSEDLCYFPGREYAQLLGGTSYEMNNYAENAESRMTTFAAHYGNLYIKNQPYFEKWGMIIGEFACGSGGNSGDSTGMELGRNAAAQAAWVEGMFEELYADDPAPYAKQIKGLIWFNCNDVDDDGIFNRLQFANPNGGYDDLAATHAAFRNGFAKANGK